MEEEFGLKRNILDYRTNITIPKTDSKGNPVTRLLYIHT